MTVEKHKLLEEKSPSAISFKKLEASLFDTFYHYFFHPVKNIIVLSSSGFLYCFYISMFINYGNIMDNGMDDKRSDSLVNI